jgi:hypothetical protein
MKLKAFPMRGRQTGPGGSGRDAAETFLFFLSIRGSREVEEEE